MLIIIALLVACRGRDAATIATPQPLKAKTVVTGPPQDVRNANIHRVLTFDASRVIERSDVKVEPGKPVVLTMRLKESPGGLQTSAEWLDDDGEPLLVERKPMNGAKVATFASPKKLAPGHYRVVGYWGGNIAADHEFEIRRR